MVEDLSADLPMPAGTRPAFLVATLQEAEHGEVTLIGGDEEHTEATAYVMPHELPNIYTLTTALIQDLKGGHEDDAHGEEHVLPFYINPLFSFGYAAVFAIVVMRIMKKRSLEAPSKPQVAVELIFSGLFNFFGEIIGEKHARKFVPFVGTLFIFILLNNWLGLIPLLKSPTAYFQTTVGLGLCTFFYVNFHGIKEGGVKHYFWHLCGSPRDVIGWCMSPMMFVLELLGTFIKPLSLSLRLYGNVFGEDQLLAAFLGLGIILMGTIFSTAIPWVGIPLHTPFLFLATLTGLIQAVVFSLLSAIYITLLLPHDDHDDHSEGEDDNPLAA